MLITFSLGRPVAKEAYDLRKCEATDVQSKALSLPPSSADCPANEDNGRFTLLQQQAQHYVVQTHRVGKSLTTRLLRDQGAGPQLPEVSPTLALMRNHCMQSEWEFEPPPSTNSSTKDEWVAVQACLLAGANWISPHLSRKIGKQKRKVLHDPISFSLLLVFRLGPRTFVTIRRITHLAAISQTILVLHQQLRLRSGCQ